MEIGYGNNLNAIALYLFLHIKGFSGKTVDNSFVLHRMRITDDIW
jgi:hypothetical protein